MMEVSLLERCPHFRGWYVQASMELGPEDVFLLSTLCRPLKSWEQRELVTAIMWWKTKKSTSSPKKRRSILRLTNKSCDSHVMYKAPPIQACLTSSLYTNCQELDSHAIRRWAADGTNFSLSTDDPGIMGCDLVNEYSSAARQIGLDKSQLVQCVSKIKSSFIQDFLGGEEVCGAQRRRYAWVWEYTKFHSFLGGGDCGCGGEFHLAPPPVWNPEEVPPLIKAP